MSEPTGNCWNCGQALLQHDLGREALCPGCQKETHVCRNCRWYSRGRPNDCLEPMAEQVLDKLRANFCGYFEAKHQSATGGTSQDTLRSAAEALFKS